LKKKDYPAWVGPVLTRYQDLK